MGERQAELLATAMMNNPSNMPAVGSADRRYLVWGIWFYICFFAVAAVFYPALCLAVYVLKRHALYFRLRRTAARAVLRLTGIRPVRLGAAMPEAPVVYCANHSSYLDIVLLLAVLPDETCFLGKAELAAVPLLGDLFRRVDVAVERATPSGSAKAYKRGLSLLGQGHNLVIFPEGTTTTGTKLRPFKDGAFKLAVAADVDVVPVTLFDNWRLLPEDASHRGRAGRSRYRVHQPARRTGDAASQGRKHLKQHTFEVIQRELDGAWPPVGDDATR